MDYLYLLNHKDLFPYIIGITYKQFEQILHKFSPALRVAEHEKAYSKKRLRIPGGGRKATLKTDRQKLFFILFYYKVYPTFRFAQCIFHLDKHNCLRWKEFLEPILFQALGFELKLPIIRVKCFSQWIEICPELKNHIVDASEREIQRPKDGTKQGFFYSGKKKKHTVKNQIRVSPSSRKILSVSETVEGKRHDKKLLEDDPLVLKIPPNSIVLGDSGYQGAGDIHPAHWIKFATPKKKPQGKELSENDKITNRFISSIRVRVEHPFAYLKHFNILKNTFRNRIEKAHLPFANLACVYNFTRDYK